MSNTALIYLATLNTNTKGDSKTFLTDAHTACFLRQFTTDRASSQVGKEAGSQEDWCFHVLATGRASHPMWAREYILCALKSLCVKWERLMSYLSGSKEMSVQGLEGLGSSPLRKTVVTSGKSECQSHSEFCSNSCSSSPNQCCPRARGIPEGRADHDEFVLDC